MSDRSRLQARIAADDVLVRRRCLWCRRRLLRMGARRAHHVSASSSHLPVMARVAKSRSGRARQSRALSPRPRQTAMAARAVAARKAEAERRSHSPWLLQSSWNFSTKAPKPACASVPTTMSSCDRLRRYLGIAMQKLAKAKAEEKEIDEVHVKKLQMVDSGWTRS